MARRMPRALARAPIPLFERGLGWLLGGRVMMLEHRGRRTGLARRAVLEVLEREPGALVLVSGYGRTSQWFRNVRANPEVRVWTGAVRGAPGCAEVLPPEEARQRLQRYRDRHPRSSAVLGRVLGLPELASGDPLPPDIGRRLPVVRVAARPPGGCRRAHENLRG
ncbi:nitroreductase family deazaflavin-dependent oxidoreductase [Saccharopolyspora rosea]|uniref:Nitroreductase family deazaflavin-dependent oxidoreductase n=2 Tax=Saccharopolyspora rosea TaxID=524884 RepID=A0ABW3FSM9_9PSEU